MADLVLYDGVCGLCNRMNRFILERDSADRFQFASLQGSIAHELLRSYGRNADLDTVYVVANYREPGEVLLAKGHAVLFVLKALGGVWSAARMLEVVPGAYLDAIYDCVARRRYRWFGRYEMCMAPQGKHRAKFLDDLTRDR